MIKREVKGTIKVDKEGNFDIPDEYLTRNSINIKFPWVSQTHYKNGRIYTRFRHKKHGDKQYVESGFMIICGDLYKIKRVKT